MSMDTEKHIYCFELKSSRVGTNCECGGGSDEYWMVATEVCSGGVKV